MNFSHVGPPSRNRDPYADAQVIEVMGSWVTPLPAPYFRGERFPDYNLNIFDSDIEEYESMDEFIGVEPTLKAFPRPNRVEDEECPICFSLISSKGRASLNCGHVFCMDCISTSIIRKNINCPMCRDEICKPHVMESVHRDQDIAIYEEAFNEGYSQGQEHEEEAQADSLLEAREEGFAEGHDVAESFAQEWRKRYNALYLRFHEERQLVEKFCHDKNTKPLNKFHRTTSM